MSSTKDFTCVFCSETFEDKESLQDHFRKHGDPKFPLSKTKGRFENEPCIKSEKTEENELVSCDVCDEMFKSISKAITHKHKVHPDHDAKYFCPWCGKLFTMKHLYNKHMASTHANMLCTEENGYHCDSCNVDFLVPSAMVYHNKFFHRQDSELPSIGHSKKVKTFNQELIQIYYCPFCGEEYNNKVNLHKHMADDHSDENQSPDVVLRCPLCDAVFYHLDAYELHLSFHSSDDVYSDDSEVAMSMTEFSLESVPPVMEKVEEETKSTETEGVDKFLQLIMDDSANNDGLDRPKSKKHKKHKKSKKAAITLDEFLNMNKDVFGDGLDVQGIEEVPTQQVLKKFKGKKDNTTKTIPASAIAKLKKQGITVKSNSITNSPTFKTNRNLTINKLNIIPNSIPMKGVEKPKAVTSSNDLLTKLLNQGNNQIKIVKKSSAENLNKDKLFDQANDHELETTNIIKALSENNLPLQDAEVKNGNNNDEMEQDACDVQANYSSISKDLINNTESNNDTDMENNSSLTQHGSATANDEKTPLIYYNNETNKQKFEQTKVTSESQDSLQEHEADMHMSDPEHSFDTNGDDIETNASDEDNRNVIKNKQSIKLTEENCNTLQRHGSLQALKHLSGVITIKPAHIVEDKSGIMQTGQLNTEKETDEVPQNTQLKVATSLGNNVQNLSLKKPYSPTRKVDTPPKSIDALKILNKQLTITPCVSSTTKSNDESEEDEPDNYNTHDKINTPMKNIINEKDNANFKTPMSVTKQLNTSAILKRLTSVTAKHIAVATNIPQENSYQSTDFRKSVIQKNDTNKQIDQNIEIFNIDDSDSDQELSNEESGHNQLVNSPTSNETKITPLVLKNISKNITIKPTNPYNKNSLNIKTEATSDRSKHVPDGDAQSPSSNESIIFSQNKHINLNHTLKKLGNNISIKSQYSSPDLHKYHMLHDEDRDDHFDTNDEGSDPETTSQVKITEVQEDEENLPSDNDMEHNQNVIVQSPHGAYSENEEETHNSQSDEEKDDDFETQIKTNTLSKEISASKCIDNFKRNNKELTVKSLSDKNSVLAKTGSPRKIQDEGPRITNKLPKDMAMNQFRAAERQNDHEVMTKNVNSSASQKVTNQINTVKTVKTFQSETVIEEITTTVTKTVRTVNQSSNQVSQNANATTFRPRIMVSNQQAKPLHGMMVRNAQTVGSKIRNAAPSPRPTMVVPAKATGQLVPVRPQNQIVSRVQGVYKPSLPGPSNIRKVSPQPSITKPVIGKPLKISPLAMNQTLKRAPETITGHFNCFKRPKDLMAPSMNASDDDNDSSVVNYSSASSSRSDFSTTTTKLVKGKSAVTATQTRSEQHSEQQITKLSNMAGLKIVRSNAKQASQVETKNDITSAKRTTMDAIEKLQKQGLLIKKPRIETPQENDYYNSDSEGCEQDYEDD